MLDSLYIPWLPDAVVMASRVLLPLALAACAAGSVLPRTPGPGLVSFAIEHQRSPRPLVSKRAASDTEVPLYNISTVSYLISSESWLLVSPPPYVRVADARKQ